MQLSNISLAITRLCQTGFFPGAALDLDLTSGNQTLDPRVTFTRTSNATVTGPDGAIGYAPHNLLTYSEQFDNGVWVKGNSTVTENSTVAPDGTMTADKLVENYLNAAHNISASANPVTGLSYTFSVYLKSAERSFVRVQSFNATGDAENCIFNLNTGEISSQSGTSESKISYVGNGWYRCSIVLINNTDTNSQLSIQTYLDGTSGIYTGDGTSGIYIWGAQLNVGSLQPYYPTTVKNLLGFTQEFDNAAWTKNNATVTANAAIAPDGAMAADKLVENTAGDSHLALSTLSFLSGTSYTYSIYGKEDATSAKRYLTLFLPGTAFSGANYWCSFDLATGAVINGSASIVGSATAMGNGWYRCSVQATANLTGSGGVQIRLQDASNNINNYTGDGTSGIYIWGAQLSDSASLDPYVYNPGAAPAASAYYGPRFDYDPVTLQPKGLLLEEQRTNLCLHSKEIDSALYAEWQFGIGAMPLLPSGTIAAPDGTMSGKTYTVVANNPNTGYQVMTVTANTVYTWSLYVRLGTLPLSDYKIAFRDDTAGVFIAADVVPTLIPVGGGWSRLAYTLTTPAGCVSLRCYPIRSLNVATGGTVSFWGAQLEAGAFPTSYIPTTTAAATRAADVAVMTGTNFSSWYRQDEGTLFVEVGSVGNANALRAVTLSDGTLNNQAWIRSAAPPTNAAEVYTAGAFVAQMGVNTGGAAKTALAVKANDFAVSVNGGAAATDTSGALGVYSQMSLGANFNSSSTFLNGHIRRIAYFPRRLSNSELQAITA